MNMNTTETRRGNTKATDELETDGSQKGKQRLQMNLGWTEDRRRDGRQKKKHPLMSMRSMGDMGYGKTLS